MRQSDTTPSPQSIPQSQAAASRHDRVLLTTRILSVCIIPFLLAAFLILYFLPGRSKELFAWGIQPRMTAMMLGVVYFGGAYFFARAAFARCWHTVALGFLPVTVFASLLGLATLLHWEVFTHGSAAFLLWAILYFTTPLLVPLAWLLNRQQDSGQPEAQELLPPVVFRWFHGGTGVLTLALGVLLFLQLDFMLASWPWKLSLLTAQVVGTMFLLTAAGEVSIALERRWSAVRVALHSQIITVAGIALALFFSWEDFQPSNPFTWLFVGGVLVLLVGSVGLYLWLEPRAQAIRARRGE
jgi:hypothetical protein